MTATHQYDDLVTNDVWIAPDNTVMEVRDNINNVTKAVAFRLERLSGFFVDWDDSELALVVDGMHTLRLRFDTTDDGQGLANLIDRLIDIMKGAAP